MFLLEVECERPVYVAFMFEDTVVLSVVVVLLQTVILCLINVTGTVALRGPCFTLTITHGDPVLHTLCGV